MNILSLFLMLMVSTQVFSGQAMAACAPVSLDVTPLSAVQELLQSHHHQLNTPQEIEKYKADHQSDPAAYYWSIKLEKSSLAPEGFQELYELKAYKVQIADNSRILFFRSNAIPRHTVSEKIELFSLDSQIRHLHSPGHGLFAELRAIERAANRRAELKLYHRLLRSREFTKCEQD